MARSSAGRGAPERTRGGAEPDRAGDRPRSSRPAAGLRVRAQKVKAHPDFSHPIQQTQSTQMTLTDRLQKTGGRKLLACDGGGIRGIISVEILAKIEADLRAGSGQPDLVLADYFDYVAGTSTGAIIATLVALGF